MKKATYITKIFNNRTSETQLTHNRKDLVVKHYIEEEEEE